MDEWDVTIARQEKAHTALLYSCQAELRSICEDFWPNWLTSNGHTMFTMKKSRNVMNTHIHWAYTHTFYYQNPLSTSTTTMMKNFVIRLMRAPQTHKQVNAVANTWKMNRFFFSYLLCSHSGCNRHLLLRIHLTLTLILGMPCSMLFPVALSSAGCCGTFLFLFLHFYFSLAEYSCVRASNVVDWWMVPLRPT